MFYFYFFSNFDTSRRYQATPSLSAASHREDDGVAWNKHRRDWARRASLFKHKYLGSLFFASEMVTHFSNSYKPVQLLKVFFLKSVTHRKYFCLGGRLYLDKMTDFETKELGDNGIATVYFRNIIFKPKVQEQKWAWLEYINNEGDTRNDQTCHMSKWLVESSRPTLSANPVCRKSSYPSPPEMT